MIKFLRRSNLRGVCSSLQFKRMWSTLGRNSSRQLVAAGASGEGSLFHHISVDQETECGQEVGPEYKTSKSTHSDLFPLARFPLPRFLQPSITVLPAGVLVKHPSLSGTFRLKPQQFSLHRAFVLFSLSTWLLSTLQVLQCVAFVCVMNKLYATGISVIK